MVVQTLAGNAPQLKERTNGIAVFERTNDYDTGDDSIVRVTANEVRKRLGQYYGRSAGAHPIQIELRRGSYVPEFRIQAPRRGKTAEAHSVLELADGSPRPVAISQATPRNIPPLAEAGFVPLQANAKTRNSRRPLLYSVILVSVVLAGTIVLGLLRYKAPNGITDLWNSFLHPSSPVLVCIDSVTCRPEVQAVLFRGSSFGLT